MLFSIVIPVYNVEKYLDECMQSILCQIETVNNNCEILLIDDGSTDNSGKICDSYGEKFPEIVRVFHKNNEGLLATRRYGYKRASGEYIINCDSDDLLESDMLRLVKGVIDKYNNPDIILINYNSYDGIKKKVAYENIFSDANDSVITKEALLREYMSGHSIVSVCGKIIKRSCININMDYQEYGRLSTGEDTLQSIEFFTNANSYVYLNRALYDYRCGSGMTNKFDNNYYFTFKKIFEKIQNNSSSWNLKDFDQLFAIKVLQTAGRAVTQARYKKWSSIKEQKQYLNSISEDDLFKSNICYIRNVKHNLQNDHVILLRMLEKKQLFLICVLLRIKNLLSCENLSRR